jgi:hypothetical protein
MKAESWNGVRIKQKKAGSDWLVTTHMELFGFKLIIAFSDEGQVKSK